jgi:tubulin polyglutamylase TTLL9
MTANTPQDYDGKIGLLEDTFTVLNMESVIKGDEEQIGGYDLICRGNAIRSSPTASFVSYLGAFNNRTQ